MTPIGHSAHAALRSVRALVRQPAWVAISLVQPLVWLLLFGALFRRVAEIPGFAQESYLEFLTPGVVVMTAVLSAAWTGMGFIDDINRGVMDRLLVSPIWRGALNVGSVAQAVLSVLVQCLVVVGVALLLGARFENGVAGVAVLLVVAGLLAAVVGSLSNGVAVLTRHRESLIGIVSLVSLPLVFVSSALMQASLQPGWVRAAARLNPVEWATEAGRSALTESEPGLVASRLGLLALLLVASAAFATRAFRTYQRSI